MDWTFAITKDCIPILARVPAFEGSPPEQLSALAQACQLRHLPARALVTWSDLGSKAGHYYLVQDGRIKLSADVTNGERVFLRSCAPPDLFYTKQPLKGAARLVAQTVTPSELVIIPHVDLQRFLLHHQSAATAILAQEAFLLQVLLDRLQDIATLPVPKRLARMIVSLGQRYGVQSPEGLHIDLDLTQLELAQTIGATREATSAVLSELKVKNLIAVGPRTLTILDLAGLTRVAESRDRHGISEDESPVQVRPMSLTYGPSGWGGADEPTISPRQGPR